MAPPRGAENTSAWNNGSGGLLALLAPAHPSPTAETQSDHATYRRRRHGEAPIIADSPGPTCGGDDPPDDPDDDQTDENDDNSEETEQEQSSADLLTQDGSAWTSTGADPNGALE